MSPDPAGNPSQMLGARRRREGPPGAERFGGGGHGGVDGGLVGHGRPPDDVLCGRVDYRSHLEVSRSAGELRANCQYGLYQWLIPAVSGGGIGRSIAGRSIAGRSIAGRSIAGRHVVGQLFPSHKSG